MSGHARSALRRALCVGFGLALIALGPQAAWAQTGTAAISGRVTDAQGLALPGVAVTATSAATATARTVVTNETGRYQMTALQPGEYTVSFELSGFQTLRYEGLVLAVDVDLRRDAQLEVGGVQETVTVTAEAPIINTVDASVGNYMTPRQIQTLPLEAASIVGLLSLQPGVTFIPVTNAATDDPRYGAVAGARSDQQNVTLDGVDVNDPQLQTAFTSAVRVTQAALQEFRVSTTNYGADQGRSSGPQVSMVTRSGTNNLDGSAFWALRRTATSTNEYFLELAQEESGEPSAAPLLDKDIFGASIGGPIRRDKFFFFGNFQTLTEKSESPISRAVPSDSFRDGVLMYRCASAAACPGGSVTGFSSSHSVPAGWYGLSPAELAAIDPLGIGPSVAASQYFSQFPSPNEPGLDGQNIVGYRFAAPIQNDFRTYIARLDIKPTGNQSIFGRFNLQDDVINSAPQFPGQVPNSQTTFNNFGTAIGWDKVFGTNLVNTFRYGLTRIDTATNGLRDSNYVSFRFIDQYEGNTTTTTRQTPTNNFVDDVSWLKGDHSVKFGTNIRFSRIPSTRDSGSWLSVSINPSWISGVGRTYMPGRASCTTPGCNQVPAVASNFAAGYADAWLNVLGVLSQANLRANYDRDGNLLPVGEPVARRYATDEYEFYFQDTWQPAENLTLTAGVRYSLYSPPYEVNGLEVAPTISMGQWFADREQMGKDGVPSYMSPLVEFDLAGPKNGRPGFYDWDYNNFAPRFSVAWQPRADSGVLGWLTGGDKMTIRGGYSKVFDRIGQGLALNFDSGFAFGMSTSISSPFGAPYETDPAVRFVDTTTMPPTMPTAPPGGFPQTPPVRAGIITQSIDDTIVTPSAHMVSAMFGRELPGGYSLEGGYIGRFGRDLLIRRDIAMPLNLTDPDSGMDYFTAAQTVILATQAAGLTDSSPTDAYSVISAIPYWENLFPDMAYAGLNATQAVAEFYNAFAPDYITALWLMDQYCYPACSRFGDFSYFTEQYDSLAALSSIGRSNYNSMVLTLRKRYSNGYQFDVNYTLSESKDQGSNAERGSAFGTYGAGGYSGFLVNSWDPELNYSYSDFDVRHQINTNWVWDLPFGQGRRFGTNASGALNHLIGDWTFSGLVRWTSGFPFSVINCRSCWATNWNLQGNATLIDPNRKPETGLVENKVDGRPSVFIDPDAALEYFRFTLPGEAGDRNVLRGDGYFTIDMSLSKAWHLPFGNSRLRFRWDVFNLTNTAKFDVNSLNVFPDRSGFGRYDSTLATCDARAGRCMQFSFAFQF